MDKDLNIRINASDAWGNWMPAEGSDISCHLNVDGKPPWVKLLPAVEGGTPPVPYNDRYYVREANNNITLSWEDSDPDSNAEISLYYDTDNSGEDGILIMDMLMEDPDGSGDSHTWDIAGVDDPIAVRSKGLFAEPGTLSCGGHSDPSDNSK